MKELGIAGILLLSILASCNDGNKPESQEDIKIKVEIDSLEINSEIIESGNIQLEKAIQELEESLDKIQ